MFCFQCQEAARGTGCTLKGVYGKDSRTAASMDMLLFVVRGVSVVADAMRNAGHTVDDKVNRFVVDALFATITNANFDEEIQHLQRPHSLHHQLYRAAPSGSKLP